VKTLWEFIQQFWKSLRPWTVVNPWEQAVRVRFGRWRRRLGPGVHFKLPAFDTVFTQSVRRRVSQLHLQTLATRDGRTVVVAGAIAYEIADIDRLYDTLHHAEDSLMILGMAALAREIRRLNLSECDPAKIEEHVAAELDFGRFGIGDAEVYLTSFAATKTYRLLTENSSYGIRGEALDTCAAAP
jgi:hypothetical protein